MLYNVSGYGQDTVPALKRLCFCGGIIVWKYSNINSFVFFFVLSTFSYPLTHRQIPICLGLSHKLLYPYVHIKGMKMLRLGPMEGGLLTVKNE